MQYVNIPASKCIHMIMNICVSVNSYITLWEFPGKLSLFSAEWERRQIKASLLYRRFSFTANVGIKEAGQESPFEGRRAAFHFQSL